MKLNLTILSLVFLNGLKEGFFIVLAPFLPEQFDTKDVPELAYTPLFMYNLQVHSLLVHIL